MAAGAVLAGLDRGDSGPVAERLRVREIDDDEGPPGADHALGHGFGGDVAAGADGAVVRHCVIVWHVARYSDVSFAVGFPA